VVFKNLHKIENLFNHGFCKINLPKKNLSHLKENINFIDVEKEDQENGYSTKINHRIDTASKKIIEDLVKDTKMLYEVKKYLRFASEVNVLLLKTKYNHKALENPTGAMLWHRDLDDYFRQLKILIPLNEHNLDNGCFSVASRKIADRKTIFIDRTLKERKDNKNEDFKFRVSDKVFRKNFSHYIYDFEAKEGDCLIVDTNHCYHRGGQILKPNLERNFIHIHLGYFTNIHHKFMKNKKMILPFLFVKSMRAFIKILRTPVGNFNSKKKIIS
tara:strand:+ start:412 stop:1227 length:816 start_codon:yes stop_codon:yes gene_type:complete